MKNLWRKFVDWLNHTDKASVVRMAVAVLAVAKIVLQSYGIDFGQATIDAVVDVVGGLFAIYAAWKNQNLTQAAVAAQKVLDDLKAQKTAK